MIAAQLGLPIVGAIAPSADSPKVGRFTIRTIFTAASGETLAFDSGPLSYGHARQVFRRTLRCDNAALDCSWFATERPHSLPAGVRMLTPGSAEHTAAARRLEEQGALW